jgi:intracellular multiplication protein IcmJ
MQLQALTFEVHPALWLEASQAEDKKRVATPGAQPCAFCGVTSGPWKVMCGARPTCPLCCLPLQLARPRIDQEAALIWFPQMSQQAINAVVRQTHIVARARGETRHTGMGFRNASNELRAAYSAQAVLLDCAAAAASRVGTASPHELGLALQHLSRGAYANRAGLLGGLRLLPLGRFFVDGCDVYPQIVDAWRRPSKAIGPYEDPSRDGFRKG